VLGRASDEEALRLVLAFYCIMEPEKRSALIALAERMAGGSRAIEGVTHFKLLETQHSEN
jgi:quinol monooxygenase YgiN